MALLLLWLMKSGGVALGCVSWRSWNFYDYFLLASYSSCHLSDIWWHNFCITLGEWPQTLLLFRFSCRLPHHFAVLSFYGASKCISATHFEYRWIPRFYCSLFFIYFVPFFSFVIFKQAYNGDAYSYALIVFMWGANFWKYV